MNVWVFYRGDHDVGGGGAEVRFYTSLEIALKHHPGNWSEFNNDAPNWYENQDADYYHPEMIYEAEVVSE